MLSTEDINCICLDWKSGSRTLYTQAANNIRVLGAQIAYMISIFQVSWTEIIYRHLTFKVQRFICHMHRYTRTPCTLNRSLYICIQNSYTNVYESRIKGMVVLWLTASALIKYLIQVRHEFTTSALLCIAVWMPQDSSLHQISLKIVVIPRVFFFLTLKQPWFLILYWTKI